VLCFWPAAGTALVAVTRLGWRTLPALALVQIAASLLGAPILTPVQILILSLGCSLQAWTGAALWRRLSHLTHERRPTQRNVSLFMVVCLALGLIGGALSTVAVWINQHPVSWTQWSQCVVAHTLGAFVMTPLLLHTSTLRARLKDRAWCRELALFAAAVVLACSLLYARMAPVLSIGFVLGPVLGWGALRLRLDGAVLLNLIVASLSLPFLTMHQPEHLLPMSMLLSVCIGSALLMASLSDDITLHDHQRSKIVERLESAYHALQNQEHQLRTLFDHLPDPIVVIDESTLYYANEAAHRLHSTLFPSQPQASRWLAILPAHRLLSDERTLRAEDGLDHIIEVRSAPFVWSGHSGRLCTLRDLTGQRKTESALHASETRFERIFQLCPDAIIIVSHDEQRIVELNDSCERLLGLRREETLGRLITEIGLWPDLTRRASLLDEVAIHGEVRGREEQLRHRNGERLTVEVSSRNMTWNGSRYLVSILANITERKRAEVALRASEERHRLLLENLHDLVFEVDAHGVCRYASPNHELLLGFAPDHLVDKAMIDMIHPEDRPAFLLHQSQSSEAPMRIRVINSANQWRLLECSYCNLRTPEGSHRSIVNARDVTDHVHEQEERLKLERQLRQAQKLEAIGTLAGGIAHDFNNVLCVILGNAELASLDLTPAHPLGPYIQNIISSSHRARDLVAQILTFSRRREQPRSHAGLLPIIRETTRLLRSTIPANIEIVTDLPETDEPVLCDPSQIHQVLMNLCTNAIHAMRPQGGSLTLALAPVEIDRETAASHARLQEGRYLRLTVRDTGCGMSEAVLGRIFEPFFTTKGTGEGTGLGLAVVHGIIESHQGDISVQSQEGQGTVFTIHLPCTSVAPSSSKPARRPRYGQGETILVIDDERAIADMLFKMLGRLGYEPVCHTDPVRAISVYANSPEKFSAVLCDLSMPKISGLQVARHIRQHTATPMILMSGFMRPEEADEARRLGIAGLIDKPLDSATVANELTRVLSLPATQPNS